MTMMIFRKNRSRQAALAMAKYTIDDDDNDFVEDRVGVEKREPATPVFAANRKILKKTFSVSSIMSKLLFFNKKQQTREATIALAKFAIDDEDGETDTDAEERDEADIEFVESDASVNESEDDIMPQTVHSYSDDDDEMTTASPFSHDHNTMLHANKRQRTDYYVRPTYNYQNPPETMFGSSACFSATQKQPIHTMQNVMFQHEEL
eukprot:CAMPEP_0198303804 /NCGR_PEP_ID=MMETSP1449-20131203/57075_1 /TAXON_ID=420275 /ORGANISM="Attheya septentrionalis, Strain CCMP2084" /LENGTH=205 /DNA_ID=CAMNT_0044006311 /DNA_START=14 /DNA_END=631 /DNA_ORIENTATION=+